MAVTLPGAVEAPESSLVSPNNGPPSPVYKARISVITPAVAQPVAIRPRLPRRARQGRHRMFRGGSGIPGVAWVISAQLLYHKVVRHH